MVNLNEREKMEKIWYLYYFEIIHSMKMYLKIISNENAITTEGLFLIKILENHIL